MSALTEAITKLVPIITTILAPLLSSQFIIPALLHPYRWGGIPFRPPKALTYKLMNYTFILILIGLSAVISNMMATAQECRQIDLKSSFFHSRTVIKWALGGLLFFNLFTIFKAILLTFFSFIPYAEPLIWGLLASIFTLIGTVRANSANIKFLC